MLSLVTRAKGKSHVLLTILNYKSQTELKFQTQNQISFQKILSFRRKGKKIFFFAIEKKTNSLKMIMTLGIFQTRIARAIVTLS